MGKEIDIQFELDNFMKAIDDKNLAEAEEWRDGIMRVLAWNFSPRTVALMDEAIKSLEKQL